MYDPLTISFIVGAVFVLAVHFTIRFCADEETKTSTRHDWWDKAKFLAMQRKDYKDYCNRLVKEANNGLRSDNT